VKNGDCIVPSVNYCDALDRCILYCILLVFMLVLCCFCVATEFSVNKDLYFTSDAVTVICIALIAKGRLRASEWKLLIVGRRDSWTVPDFRRTLKTATVDIIDMNCKHTYCTSTLTLTVLELNGRCKFNAVQNIWATRQVTKINCYNNNWTY